jgi:4-oxalocrotonate tautomerase
LRRTVRHSGAPNINGSHGAIMPYVAISTVKGILDAEQKKTLHQRITDVMVEVEGRGNPEFRKMVWIKIDEQEPAQWCAGGQLFTAEQITKTYGPIGADGRRPAQAKA